MTDEEKTTEESAEDVTASADEDDKDARPGNPEGENNRPDDTLADEKKCPECGAPVDDVRATCINCGYEYSDEDHEDAEAGNEFMAGTQVDDEGNEIPEDPDEGEGSDDASQDSEDSSDDSDDSESSNDSESSDTSGEDDPERPR